MATPMTMMVVINSAMLKLGGLALVEPLLLQIHVQTYVVMDATFAPMQIRVTMATQ